MTVPNETYDVAVIGAGAAGLMAAIWIARTDRSRKIVLLDGASRVGAKILIAGGGRCNVTHFEVKPDDFCGSSKNAIKKVLSKFNVDKTVPFFEELGVQLKREETGKLFPVTDSARTVLDGLLNELAKNDVPIWLEHRIESIEKQDNGFNITGSWGSLQATNIVLATGGKSVPKTGSDGLGLQLAKRLGHTLTPRLLPALVPLTLPDSHPLKQLSGITLETQLEVRETSGKKITSAQGNLLLTHQGISGPVVLDISRHYLEAQAELGDVQLVANWLPDFTPEQFNAKLLALGNQHIRKYLKELLPKRMAEHLCDSGQITADATFSEMTKLVRKNLVKAVAEMDLPISGSRGFQVAEVTAGGIPLKQIDLKTMQSRECPGLYLCGEICDVDGRIGGFNFQWAWASGYVAGVSV
ncbi:MAG: aminoacetone oxidase family FAD-binding enzyme [Blastopirellula sp.]|nr:MAG: aminoacetone oxidase family FAD-binding enzyme [Blastopirellula sp.]